MAIRSSAFFGTTLIRDTFAVYAKFWAILAASCAIRKNTKATESLFPIRKYIKKEVKGRIQAVAISQER